MDDGKKSWTHRPGCRSVSGVRLLLRDRKRLARLMIVGEVGVRELADAAGYRSHTQVWRMYHGLAEGCDREYAERIASRLGVELEDLFVP